MRARTATSTPQDLEICLMDIIRVDLRWEYGNSSLEAQRARKPQQKIIYFTDTFNISHRPRQFFFFYNTSAKAVGYEHMYNAEYRQV
jgi:hypothetical protein